MMNLFMEGILAAVSRNVQVMIRSIFISLGFPSQRGLIILMEQVTAWPT